MTYTLDLYLYRDGDRASTPLSATSEAELDQLLDFALQHEQPHPPQIIARERPKVGPLERPDHLLKIDLATGRQVGAILFLSPEAWVPRDDEADDRTVVWVTKSDQPIEDAPELFIDRATRKAFPADAALPFKQVRAALREFRLTGERPTCVQWQPSPGQVY